MGQGYNAASGEPKNINEAIRKSFKNLPDPLHIELPHHHKKLLEAIYFGIVIAVIFSLMVLGSMGVLSVAEANASAMIVLFLAILLGIMLIEKSSISAIAHKPKKASS